VPLTAVVNRAAGPLVWVVSDGKATPRAVEVARFREQTAQSSPAACKPANW
jgi:hypothetical protein